MEASNNRNLFKGILIGSLLGAAAGIVLASTSRKELRPGFHLDSRTKIDSVFERAKHIFGGRRRSEGVILEDLEEPDEFVAEA